jgi:hypothetical protein
MPAVNSKLPSFSIDGFLEGLSPITNPDTFRIVERRGVVCNHGCLSNGHDTVLVVKDPNGTFEVTLWSGASAYRYYATHGAAHGLISMVEDGRTWRPGPAVAAIPSTFAKSFGSLRDLFILWI